MGQRRIAMRRWIRILSMATLAPTLAGGTADAEDRLEDFLGQGADPDDFLPGTEVVSSGSLFFAAGSTYLTDSAGDAAIIAVDARDGREVWRATEGELDVLETFSVVGAAGGRVCAAGTLVNPPNPQNFVAEREVLVAYYRTKRGQRL